LLIIIRWLEAFFGSNTFNNAIMPILIALVVSGVLAWFVNKRVEELKHDNSKELEKEIFIREVTSKEKNDMLKNWSSLILDKDAIQGSSQKALTKKFEDLYLKTAMYGGQRLVVLVSLFQTNNVKKANLPEKFKGEKDIYKTLMYMAIIVSEMKKEFTDVEISPQTLIQIKFNDYFEKETLLKSLEKEIEEEYKIYLEKLKNQDTQ